MEMLIVVVVIGILVSVALPRVSRLTARDKASAAAALVQADLERAFSTAARLREAVVIEGFNSQLRYEVRDASSGEVRLTRALEVRSEYGVQTMTFSPSVVTVQPNGIASAPLTVTLTSMGATRVISMTRVGLVRRVQ
jgi:Tfp pilus assembly protein FimT